MDLHRQLLAFVNLAAAVSLAVAATFMGLAGTSLVGSIIIGLIATPFLAAGIGLAWGKGWARTPALATAGAMGIVGFASLTFVTTVVAGYAFWVLHDVEVGGVDA